MKARITVASLLSTFLLAPVVSEACTRAVYFGKDGQVVTGRTMDWFISDMDTNLWLYPRGLERSGATKSPFTWKSKYGSVVTTIYEGATADGMNEKGLVANLLYLPESRYPAARAGDKRRTLPNCAFHGC
jgi:penicillin V acylase-like amidase (Ntn superfamily)